MAKWRVFNDVGLEGIICIDEINVHEQDSNNTYALTKGVTIATGRIWLVKVYPKKHFRPIGTETNFKFIEKIKIGGTDFKAKTGSQDEGIGRI